MGLLDDLIGQLAAGSSSRREAPPPQATSPAMSTVLTALIPIAIAMLRNSGRESQAGSGRSAGGGLGDLLGQLLGGGRGASGTGGLGGLLEQFQRAGYGDQVRSWVGTGQNVPLPPGALEQTFGRGGIADLARMAGVSEADATRGLSELLPEMVDRVTPNGEIPDEPSLLRDLSDLSRRLRAR